MVEWYGVDARPVVGGEDGGKRGVSLGDDVGMLGGLYGEAFFINELR